MNNLDFKKVDYDKLMQSNYLNIKKKFIHTPMDLKSRSHIFKPFDALEGYHEELRRVEREHLKQYENE